MPALLALFLLSVQALAVPPQISCQRLRLLELNHEPGLLVVDVRPPSAFAQSHIQGAQNVLASKIQTAGLPRDAHIIVYCNEAQCPLSSGAAQALIKDGYPRVDLLEGGLGAWIQAGYPLTTSKVRAPAAAAPSTSARQAAAALSTGAFLALDARPAKEYAAGHIPGAESAPLENLDALLPSVPKTKSILVYDRRPSRERQALAKLLAAGYQATELTGGVAAWKKMKQPLEVK